MLEHTMTTLLESCSISPPSGTETDQLILPLTFFDIIWIHFHPIRRLIFYEFPCSKTHFSDTIVPNLKISLSLTLKHYLPLAGNLVYPLNSEDEEKPKLRYIAGDAVSLAVVESTKDFDFLVANHARDADEFYDFVPQLSPPITDETDCKIVPVLALQVTLFPGRGVCIGFANHHSVGDGSSLVGFIKAWASINKLGGDDEEFLESVPLFDKSVIKDPKGIDTIFWNVMRKRPFKPPTFPLPTGRVRATYVLNQDHLRKLKDLVLSKNPGLVQVSTFVVATAYVWSCFVKSGEEFEDDEVFFFAVDCRARIDPPVPANYFGNCLGYGIAIIEHQKLVGDEGFVLAATAIAEDIRNRVNNKDQVLKGAETWFSDVGKLFGKTTVGVSGSPKFDLCSADFGWGKARKLEVVNIDGEKYAMSLCKSRDSDGGLEVGLSLPKERMERFSTIFNDGFKF